LRWVNPGPRRGEPDRLRTRFHATFGDDLSFLEYKDLVADLNQIAKLGGAEHDRRAALREFSYDFVDRSLGGDIDPSRRIVEEKHGGFSREPTGDVHLLLVSPAQAVDLLIDGGSGDCESRAFFAREVLHPLRVDQTEPSAPLILKAGKRHVLPESKAREDALPPPILRHKAHAGRHRVHRRPQLDHPAAYTNLASRYEAGAKNRLEQFGPAASEHAGQPQDLSAPDRKRYPAKEAALQTCDRQCIVRRGSLFWS
jgi:hypothetical protein